MWGKVKLIFFDFAPNINLYSTYKVVQINKQTYVYKQVNKNTQNRQRE